mgnify:CR=1 FL=1
MAAASGAAHKAEIQGYEAFVTVNTPENTVYAAEVAASVSGHVDTDTAPLIAQLTDMGMYAYGLINTLTEPGQALEEANQGFQPSYGDDEITRAACETFRQFFETECDVYFVFNGTAANSLALAALCQRHQSVLCHEIAHIDTDECGAPEFFTGGSKLLDGLFNRRTVVNGFCPSTLCQTHPLGLRRVLGVDTSGDLCCGWLGIPLADTFLRLVENLSQVLVHVKLLLKPRMELRCPLLCGSRLSKPQPDVLGESLERP